MVGTGARGDESFTPHKTRSFPRRRETSGMVAMGVGANMKNIEKTYENTSFSVTIVAIYSSGR